LHFKQTIPGPHLVYISALAHIPRYEKLVKNLEITYPDQVWVSDITSVRL